MTYFTQIDPANTRRFVGPDGQILAIYDQCRSYTLYAEVGTEDCQTECFVSEPRTYWPDEIEEVY